MAARNVAMTLILSKLGPGVTARLPHIVSSEQFDTMRAITTELKGQFHDHAPEVINGDDKAYKTASVIVNELDLAVDFFIDTLNFGRERPVGVKRGCRVRHQWGASHRHPHLSGRRRAAKPGLKTPGLKNLAYRTPCDAIAVLLTYLHETANPALSPSCKPSCPAWLPSSC
jgi:hypothetical protein